MAADTAAGAGATLAIQDWVDTFAPAVYERQWFKQRITKLPRGYGQQNFRKMGLVSGQTVATTSDGDSGVSLDGMNPTVVTMTPQWFLTAHAWSDALEWISGEKGIVNRAAAENVENGLAAYEESQLLADVQGGSNFLGSSAYDIDAAGVRAAVAAMRVNALVMGMPGSAQIFGLFYGAQHDDVMSVPEFTHAEQRGDGQNPLVSGVIGKGNAVEFEFSTLQASDANGRHNPIWVKSAFGYYNNKEAGVETQRYKKQTRVFADSQVAHAVLFQPRFVNVRTKAA